MKDPISHPQAIPVAVNALWAQAQGRRAAGELAAAGIRVLVLRGPEVQARLLGSPAAYPSADLDVLVLRSDASRARRLLADAGFRLHSNTTWSWLLAGHATYERSGFLLDLHWRLDVAPMPPRARARLTRELWRGARASDAGSFEARLDPFAVYLVAHAASAGPRSPAHALAKVAVEAADLDAVDRLAVTVRLRGAVRTARRSAPPSSLTIDGVPDVILRAASAATRGAFVPVAVRDGAREFLSYRRHRFRLVRPRKRPLRVAGRTLEWWEGVCGPGTWTESLVTSWCAGAVDSPAPVMVEVGTGTGALAVLAHARLPAARIHTTDISFRACANARTNMRRLDVPVAVHRGDLMSPLPTSLRGRVDGVVAHLPSMWLGAYEDEPSDVDGVWAPRETYEGRGGDGLGLFRRLLLQVPPWLAPGGRLVLSMQTWQWDLLAPAAMEAGFLERYRATPSPTGAIVSLTLEGDR